MQYPYIQSPPLGRGSLAHALLLPAAPVQHPLAVEQARRRAQVVVPCKVLRARRDEGHPPDVLHVGVEDHAHGEEGGAGEPVVAVDLRPAQPQHHSAGLLQQPRHEAFCLVLEAYVAQHGAIRDVVEPAGERVDLLAVVHHADGQVDDHVYHEAHDAGPAHARLVIAPLLRPSPAPRLSQRGHGAGEHPRRHQQREQPRARVEALGVAREAALGPAAQRRVANQQRHRQRGGILAVAEHQRLLEARKGQGDAQARRLGHHGARGGARTRVSLASALFSRAHAHQAPQRRARRPPRRAGTAQRAEG
mmetsp:Transcript_4964/g.15208  ORF Transcript_4964/g.15208 Transcript_4964/m.15208 type:complete len:305 (-) Transcript_4964:60-974(-)